MFCQILTVSACRYSLRNIMSHHKENSFSYLCTWATVSQKPRWGLVACSLPKKCFQRLILKCAILLNAKREPGRLWKYSAVKIKQGETPRNVECISRKIQIAVGILSQNYRRYYFSHCIVKPWCCQIIVYFSSRVAKRGRNKYRKLQIERKGLLELPGRKKWFFYKAYRNV